MNFEGASRSAFRESDMYIKAILEKLARQTAAPQTTVHRLDVHSPQLNQRRAGIGSGRG